MSDNTTFLKEKDIIPISITTEMEKSYLDYAMSVIVSRALPDVRDGLKPVHRRILYAMIESGCDFNKPYRKSARIVGEVMGKYHPHGDSAIYMSLVRMAQDFTMRLPLIDGQGNFGSMDGDSPAAMRYTESRLSQAAHTILEDIEKNTVDFVDNYDGSEKEPEVLPAQYPNLLVNGAGGIAVGMATNIPPHNLGEVIDACCGYIANPDITDNELLQMVPGPDFPTGGIIVGVNGCRSAIYSGRGSIIIRGKVEIEDIASNKKAIIINEIPYQVNKSQMVEKIADLVRDKRIEGITDLRDESDKSGVRVVIEVRRDTNAEIVLNQLYKFTPLQISFGVNMLALDNGKPQLFNLRQVIKSFIIFREEVITRRAKYLLEKARSKAHLGIGLAIAVANIDEVIKLIRSAPDPQTAKKELMERDWHASDVAPLIILVADKFNKVIDNKCKFTEEQAKAILEMRLSKLTNLERNKIDEDLKALSVEIKDYLDILSNRPRLMGILQDELLSIKEKFATPRKTSIEESELDQDIEDLIQKEDMVVTTTVGGYIKRVPLSVYRAQRRGGKGRSGINIHDEDALQEIFITNTHTPILFFSDKGQVYRLKTYKLPLGNPQSKGRALVNILPLKENEKITKLMALPEDEADWDNLNILFATSNGNIRRNDMSDFKNINAGGKIAIRLDEDDSLIGVELCNENQDILLSAKNGKCVRCPVSAVRVFKSRTSDGVRGMKLSDGDKVISLSILNSGETDTQKRDEFLKIHLSIRSQLAIAENISDPIFNEIESSLNKELIFKMAQEEEFILSITANGFGKRSSAYEYRVTNRGGSGIINIDTSERNGEVVASLPILESDEIMLITDQGQLIRCPVKDIRVAGRGTMGVRIFRLAEGEEVVSIAKIESNGEEEANDSEITNSTNNELSI